MTPRQVAAAIRQQNRAQRIVAGNSYPRRAGRWAWRHRRIAGIGMAAVGAVGAAAIAVPMIAAAGVGLGVFGVARHPAFRRVLRGCAREARQRAGRFGRWLEGQWALWRRRRAARVPLDGELLDAPSTPPRWDPPSRTVDAEVVEPAVAEIPPTRGGWATGPESPTWASSSRPAPQPTTHTSGPKTESEPPDEMDILIGRPRRKPTEQPAPEAPREEPAASSSAADSNCESEQRKRPGEDHEDARTTRWVPSERADRQPRLQLAAGNSNTINEEKQTMSHPFETANEALASTSFTPESGMDAETAILGIPSVLAGAAGSIRGVLASIAETLPQASESLEHLNGIADALDGLENQADEQIQAWRESANWVWQAQD